MHIFRIHDQYPCYQTSCSDVTEHDEKDDYSRTCNVLKDCRAILRKAMLSGDIILSMQEQFVQMYRWILTALVTT